MDSDYCTVCGNLSEDRDDENVIIGLNPIIYCDSCHIGVHLKCVGLTEVPDTFICDKCDYLKRGEDPAHLFCTYCPNRFGYLFRLKPDHSVETTPNSHTPMFAHLFCQLVHEGGVIHSFAPMWLATPRLQVHYKGYNTTAASSLDTIFKVNTVNGISSSSSPSSSGGNGGRREGMVSSKNVKGQSNTRNESIQSTQSMKKGQQTPDQQQHLSVQSGVENTSYCQFSITGIHRVILGSVSKPIKFNSFSQPQLITNEDEYIRGNFIDRKTYKRM